MHSVEPGQRSEEAANLDLLRTLAVLLVVGDHSARFLFGVPRPWMDPLGQVGVFLFFVHTSLV